MNCETRQPILEPREDRRTTSAEWVNRIVRERFSLADWIRTSMIRLIVSG
jgi:hypothetical protein